MGGMNLLIGTKQSDYNVSYDVRQIDYEDTKDLILNRHYAKRMPSISYAYGLFDDGNLVGLVTYGSPASPWLCKGVCGVENKKQVIELNRLVLTRNKKNEASFLIAKSLQMIPKPKIVVSYADTAHNHVGYVYQATNFLFTGTTKARTDPAATNGKHARHSLPTGLGDRSKRTYRSPKHRYVIFTGTKKEKARYKKALNYTILPYPK
tara:strand:+ start:570 stop:1190 length:621 start_codon:yes stop_codon:yes gene_type:complete